MSVAFPGSDVLTGSPSSTAVPGFDVLFPSAPTASSTASTSPTTTSTTTPTDTYEPSGTSSTGLLSTNTPVDLNQPGTVLADGAVVPGDPTSAASDQIQPASSDDPYWATDAPSSDFQTPVPGFSVLFPTGVETNAAVNIANAAAAAPNPYQALETQLITDSDNQLLSSLGSSSSKGDSAPTSLSAGVNRILGEVSTAYANGAYGGGTGSSIDTSA